MDMFLVQDEQAVSDVRRGSAVWDGKRSVAEETFTMGKVRQMFNHFLNHFLYFSKCLVDIYNASWSLMKILHMTSWS